MIDALPTLLAEYRQEAYLLFRRFRTLENPLLTRSDLTYEFERF